MNANRADTAPLAIRILDSFPAGEYALGALLRIASIVETEEVPTAAVECVAAPRLLINPVFVAERAETSEKLLMLVMHELHHVLLGHTTLFPRATKLDNFVFDAIINALLCRMFPSPEYLSFFTDSYREDRFPECLLRPPTPHWKPGSWNVPAALKEDDMGAVCAVYRSLYSPRGASYHEVYGIFRKKMKSANVEGVALIGGHEGGEGSGGDEDAGDRPGDGGEPNAGQGAASTPGALDPRYGGLESRSPALFEAVREIVEKWPQPPDPIAGRSLSNILREGKLKVRRVLSWRAILRKALLRVADRNREGSCRVRMVEEPAAIETPLPALDRRAIVQRSLGLQPMLYRSTIRRKRRQRTGEKVHIYLDVSGSIGSLVNPLYGAVLDCRRFVHDRVHLFSTQVADVTLAELKRGKVITTGGTDIDCVALHMRENEVRRAAIITDGYVGAPRGADYETLRGAKISVVFTPGYACQTDLQEVADYFSTLPDQIRNQNQNGGIR